MAFNWFKKISKDNPKFWETYLSHFSQDKNPEVAQRYVIFDCETTGLDFKKDVILSIGGVSVVQNMILVNDSIELFLKQDIYKKESAAIHGILKDGKEEKIVEAEAIIRFLEYIKDAILVGHHVRFDIEMINQALKRLDLGKLKNDSMDTDAMYQKFKGLQEDQHSSLDELCKLLKVEKSDRHTASGDAFITAMLFLKLKNRLSI
ncbi:3'-5' exonuclease [Flavobacterium orientale]|uniref:DNA polymerase III subunit epsilon n=1 Tax=Flavobacterium orientale TaxID=1756020 RepID=A0A917DBV2_9FLAO|nr:3'-5' exonuclease [Flavobacterium orientale]GGD23931.1 DNA polymerase III subunit epsilon [Flavobacterium orientale]